MRKPVIGVMGGGESASAEDCRLAYRLGALIAAEGWILLNEAAILELWMLLQEAPGIEGIDCRYSSRCRHRTRLPLYRYCDCNKYGGARNVINVLSSDIIVAMAGKAVQFLKLPWP